MNVAKVSEWANPAKDGKLQWYVDFDDGQTTVCFSEAAADLEIGKPLPDGWHIEAPKQEGWKPMLKAPKKGGGFGGGATAHRNTKEGQALEEERKDRRTALMQAVTFHPGAATASGILSVAEQFYDWLQSSPAPLAGTKTEGAGATPTRGHKSSPAAASGEPSSVAGDSSGEGVNDTKLVDSPVHPEGAPGGGVTPTPSFDHEHDFHPIRAGSSIHRCSVPGCPVTEKR